MLKNYILTLFVLLTTCVVTNAQLTGTINIPSVPYPTLAAAITALNAQGVGAGGVTLNLLAANPQTAPAGGYVIGDVGSLVLTSSSVTNQITITGNGNTITASSGLTVGNLNDGIFKLIGADWVRIQGFILAENPANTVNTPAASNNMTEWGVALLYASLTDGAQNNTIQNNTITLNRTYQNSFGIYSNTRHSAADVVTLADITDPTTGPNSSNKFYSNNINNVNLGIVLIGSLTAANMDNANDMGGASLATGNNITNWGGAAALSAYNGLPLTVVLGVYLLNQNNFNLSFNTIIGASWNTATALRGVLQDYSAGSLPVGTIVNNINSNTLTMTQAGTGGFQGITTACAAGTASNVTMNMNNNNFVNNAVLTPAGAITIFGLANLGAFGTMNINNNIVSGNTTTATTGGFIAITNQGAVTGTVNINDNQIGTETVNAVTFSAITTGQINPIFNSAAGGTATTTVNINNNIIRRISAIASGQAIGVSNQSSAVGVAININGNQIGTATSDAYIYSGATTGAIIPIFNSNGAATAQLSINNNSIRGITQNVLGSNTHTYILNQTFTGSVNINNNTFNSITANTTGSVTFISNSVNRAASTVANANNNSVVGGYNKPGAGGTITFFTSFGVSPVTVTETNDGNNFSNMTFTGGTTFVGWRCSDGTGATGPTRNVTNNIFNNIACGATGGGVILQCSFGTIGTVSGNTVSNITGGAGIVGFTSSSGNNTITQNTITGISSTAGIVSGISITGAAASTQSVLRNKIGNLQSNNATGTVNGILVSGGITVNLVNNLIGDLRAPSTSSTVDAIRGINITSTTAASTINVGFNTVYINATSSGANFSSSALFHTFSTTATTATLVLGNNILVNNSIPKGTGITSAFRRSAATNLNNYSTLSNNNLFFAGGTNCTSNLIYFDGTNAFQTLAAFQAFVTPRETLSITGDPKLLNPFNATSPTFLHVDPAIPSVVESAGVPVAGVTDDYDGNIRDVTTPDVGADEFAGTVATACGGTPVAGVATAQSLTLCSGNSTYICLNGQSSGTGITIQWASSGISGGPYIDIPCAAGNCLNTGSLAPGTYHFVAIVSCSTFTAQSNQVTITVNANPAVAIAPLSPTICAGIPIILTASGGSTYAWSTGGLTPAITVTPLVTTTYTVTATDVFGCTNSISNTVTVIPSPVVTATATPSTICVGGSTQLNALAFIGTFPPYTLSSLTSQTYTTLSGPGITVINTNAQLTPGFADLTQDDGGALITIPFNFFYMGNNYNQMSMCTNGWVAAGNQSVITGAQSRAPGNFFTTTIPNNTIAAWFRDMGANFPLGTGSMRHGLIGTDVYAFQWDKALGTGFTDNMATNLVSFQVNIYGPASAFPGRIEIVYGPVTVITTATPTTAAAIGVEDLTGGANHFINALNGSTTSTITSTAWPGDGNGFRFDPILPTISWSPSTFLNSTTIANPVASGVTTNTTYTVTVTAPNGCTASSSVTVTVDPQVNITGNLVVCPGTPTTLTATGGTGYVWSTGEMTAAITVSPFSNTTYTVTVTNGLCSATASTTVTTLPAPVLTETHVENTTCVTADGSINLTVSGPTGPFSYNWATPNGSGIVNGQEDQTGLTVGTYFVTVTGAANGCTSTLTITLVGPGNCGVCPLFGAFTSTPSGTACAGSNVTLTQSGLSDMGITYGIRFVRSPVALANPYVGGTLVGDVPNGSLTGGGTVATFNTTAIPVGTHFLYAILNPVPTDPVCRPSATINLTVNALPTVNAVANQIYCANASTSVITFSGSIAGTTYAWTRTPEAIGAPASGSNTVPTYVTTNAGLTPLTSTFTVTPTYTSGATCSGTPTSFTVTVNPVPQVNQPVNQTACHGSTVPSTVFATTVAGTTYTWTNNNPAIGLAANGSGNVPSFVAVNTTSATIVATITVTPNYTNGAGGPTCTGPTKTYTITISQKPAAICNNITVFLGTNGTVTITPAQINGGSTGGTVTATPLTFNCSNLGPNNVTLTVTDACAFANTCIAIVTVKDGFAPTLNNVPANITIECTAPIPPVPTNITATDNCSATVTFVQTSTKSSASQVCAYYSYNITRTWTATDPGGNKTTKIQVISVQDTQAPFFKFVPPAFLTVDCDDDQDNNQDPVPVDACDGTPAMILDIEYIFNPNGCPNSYVAFYTWTAGDNCGNTIQYVQKLTVEDKEAPIIICPSNITLTSSTPVPVSWQGPKTDDQCDDGKLPVIQIAGPLSGSTFQPGTTTTITYRVVDLCGNSSTCSFVVTIIQPGSKLGFTISGEVTDGKNHPIKAEAQLSGSLSQFTDVIAGKYSFTNVTKGYSVQVSAHNNNNPLNGVNTLDLVYITNHILGKKALNSPYKLLAADVNHSKSITTADIVELRKLILHITNEFKDVESWEFIGTPGTFTNPANPWKDVLGYNIPVTNIQSDKVVSFVGYKMGDVTEDANPNGAASKIEVKGNEKYTLSAENKSFDKGDEVELLVSGREIAKMKGLQFTLNYDVNKLDFVAVRGEQDNIGADNFGLSFLEKGKITSSIDLANSTLSDKLFTLVFKAKDKSDVKSSVSLSSELTSSEAYTNLDETIELELNFTQDGKVVDNTRPVLYQNEPNPFENNTVIRFAMPVSEEGTFSVFTTEGKLIKEITSVFAKGENKMTLDKADLPTSGIYYYQLKTKDFVDIKKMMFIR